MVDFVFTCIFDGILYTDPRIVGLFHKAFEKFGHNSLLFVREFTANLLHLWIGMLDTGIMQQQRINEYIIVFVHALFMVIAVSRGFNDCIRLLEVEAGVFVWMVRWIILLILLVICESSMCNGIDLSNCFERKSNIQFNIFGKKRLSSVIKMSVNFRYGINELTTGNELSNSF